MQATDMPSDKLKALTYRVENIPWGITKEDLVKNYFDIEDQDSIKVKSLCPSVDSVEPEEDDYTATILFRPRYPQPDGPRLSDDSITIGKDFFGFTPLYVPPKEKGPIAADIIAVTGLAGHAYGSWANSDENMWLRDYLPKDASNARILTYGYPSKLQGSSSISILQDHTSTFLHRLIDMRETAQCESRPIIFVGHSLGCLIIKKAMTDLAYLDRNRSRLPVRTIVFFAAPHRGLNTDALQTLVKGKPTAQMIFELQAKSPTLADLNSRFAAIARDIDILTCYETRQTNTAIEIDGVWSRDGPPVLMVSPESAQQFFMKERFVSSDANHSQIAKLKKGESGIYNSVKSAIKHGLMSTAKIVARADASQESQVYNHQASHDTNSSKTTLPASPPPSYLPETGIGLHLANQSAPDIDPTKPAPEVITEPEQLDLTPSNNCQPQTTLAFRDNAARLASEEVELKNEVTGALGTQLDPEVGELTAEDDSVPTIDATFKNTVANISDHHSIAARGSQIREGEDPTKAIIPDVSITISGQTTGMASSDKNPQEESGKETCCTCSRKILGPFHWACFQCEKSTPANSAFCQGCYIRSERCRMHNKKLYKRMVKPYSACYPYVIYVEPCVVEGDTDIAVAIREDDLEKLQVLAKTQQILNDPDKYGNTPLHLAASLGRVDCISLLLKNGADQEVRDHNRSTPLTVATTYRKFEVIKILLENGCNINTVFGCTSATALHVAAADGSTDIVDLLLKMNAVVDFPSDEGTALYKAVRLGAIDCTRRLLEAGANPRSRDSKDLQTPLTMSAFDGHCDIVEILLQYGAAADELNRAGRTPLYVAAYGGHLEICRLLLNCGADINALILSGWSPLSAAAIAGHLAIVKFLIDAGASGIPPPACKGKWKNLTRHMNDVPRATTAEILVLLRKAKRG